MNFENETSKSALKTSRREQDQIIDDTANILASMVKTRRSIYEKYILSQRVKYCIKEDDNNKLLM